METRRVKFLVINLPRQGKDWCAENNKAWKKQSKADTKRWTDIPFTCNGRNNIVKMATL